MTLTYMLKLARENLQYYREHPNSCAVQAIGRPRFWTNAQLVRHYRKIVRQLENSFDLQTERRKRARAVNVGQEGVEVHSEAPSQN